MLSVDHDQMESTTLDVDSSLEFYTHLEDIFRQLTNSMSSTSFQGKMMLKELEFKEKNFRKKENQRNSNLTIIFDDHHYKKNACIHCQNTQKEMMMND